MKRQKGFGMIEVLVALVLTSVGILGAAALQNRGIQYAQDSVNRNNAATLANDLIEIMRAHRDSLLSTTGQLQVKSDTDLYGVSGGLKVDAASCTDGTVPQTLTEQGSCWLKQVQASLPGTSTSAIQSQIKVCPSYNATSSSCASSNFRGRSLMVTIAWQVKPGECMDGSNNAYCTYSTRIEL